ncbi:MAG: DNA polymerase II large subunit, partial [Nanoarchaeota archaeon]|nr:DNA polymerase II large subunit [Nanoarchaeota archaeon]
INYEQLVALFDWLEHASLAKKIIFPWNKVEQERFKKGKRALELLGVEHDVTTENIVLSEKVSKSFLSNLGISFSVLEKKELSEEIHEICKDIAKTKGVLLFINKISKYKIKDKAGTFIGTRMGRPEKAKLRRLTGSPNALFPVGQEGGRLRSVNEACVVGNIKSDFPIYYCEKCKKETIYSKCETCKQETRKMIYCFECKKKLFDEKCPEHNLGQSFLSRKIDSNYYFNSAVKELDLLPEEIPKLIKGIRGTSSENHNFENLGKGLLRAMFGLAVNKDGTIRYDATELPLTHFSPKEIMTSFEKLKELGYKKDINNNNLESDDQILELMPHDIILPACPETKDEKSDDVFFNIAHFIDMLLLRFYKEKPFYNLRNKEDLVGHLVACMAPHNCAGVIGRIIGFSKAQGIFASPYMHAAMRRDCDGDEMAVMLLLDVLLNFSIKFLPAHRGGTQDAPLVLNVRIRAGEVDDQILDVELGKYPLSLYQLSEQGKHSSEVIIDNVKTRLSQGRNPFCDIKFTHGCSDINLGVVNSSYKIIPKMQEKVRRQMEVVTKIRAVDTGDVARLIIDRHFIRDIRGNLRKFSQQVFRCSKCNTKYRRPPLTGKCLNCDGRIIFTISEGSIVKYMEPALLLAEKYDVPPYIKQSLELTKSYIESIFGKESEKQEELKSWF